MIDPEIDINYLGEFETIEEVWEAYPNGGQEGDYLYINQVLYRWNKYDLSWGTKGVIESTTKIRHTFLGEVDVYDDFHVAGDSVFNGDATVKGTLYAQRVKQPNMGLFASVQALQEAIPTPDVGMWATVGNTIPSPIYRCTEEGVWSATGEVGGIDPITLNDYYTKTQTNALMEEYHEVITEDEYDALEEKEDKLYFVIESL